MFEIISLKTSQRTEFLDITDRVELFLHKSKVESGLCCLFIPHTTAGLTINENADPTVKFDMALKLNKSIPPGENYSHSEGNSDSHIKSSIIGVSIQLIINKGRLALGTWQGIYFCEFDGPRNRKIYVKILEG